MATWTWLPRDTSDEDAKYDVEEVKFGGAKRYTQRVPRVTDAKLRKWNLTFEDDQAAITAMKAFLDARNGVESFDWEEPDEEVTYKVVCKSYRRRPRVGTARHRLTATFEEAHLP